MPFDKAFNCHRPVTEEDVETEFWRLVADLEETVEVEYGADIHCTTHGSGFPTLEKHPNNPYATDPWNLNILPFHPDSLFRHIKSDISGMTVPWVYVGMTFSTFCWHNEDHYAYSANYQHFGATKTWYGIPEMDAEKFEAAMREAVPELFETQPDLLFQLVTLLTPEQLKKAGVRVYALDQRAGQFVITFPQAYHAGFNHGFNFNEAVNFAPCDWEPFGLASVERLQIFRPFAYLSRFKCDRSGKILCLVHAGYHACCDLPEQKRFAGEEHHLTYRRDEENINKMYERVKEKANTPEAWEEKFAKLLDEETTPSLKALRTLLHEGEKIPYDLPSLPNLREDADRIGFDCPEISQLQERAASIKQFQSKAARALENHATVTTAFIKDLLEEGRSFNVDTPELQAGQAWEAKAQELIAAETVHYPQLEALSKQVQANSLPVSRETLAAVDQSLQKQREAHRHIHDLTQRSRDPDFRNRPKYHYRCLKIARGKVKEDDKYTCPICDWRMKIPRDAARPKLEDLVSLADEITSLPFQPEEEEILRRIIDNAHTFRESIAQYCNPLLSTEAEAETQRFFLRKLEGAEVLLSYETNFFRQELHKWCPVASEAPPILQVSLSTRKPRPTKLQKMLVEYGVDDPDDLPEHAKGKANSLRRKAANAEAAVAAMQYGSKMPAVPNPHNAAYGPAAYFARYLVDHSYMSMEERLEHGHMDGIHLHGEADKNAALEIMGRTEAGRSRAEEIWGPDVWGPRPRSTGGRNRGMTPAGLGNRLKQEDHRVDQMFKDMTHQDDDDDTKKHKDGASGNKHVTAELLENERNGLDAMLDGD
ncbi:Lysine-specific demethylase lid [Escovopsis weberi]|uniref:Lysine-specific demethylase lid n=1 Tax=Escovopsis weberi TaxID=150374 RepID=A0A0M9VS08_ESCWE|nr:Lysine-specific demethylase lid [Escovopsis weberi]